MRPSYYEQSYTNAYVTCFWGGFITTDIVYGSPMSQASTANWSLVFQRRIDSAQNLQSFVIGPSATFYDFKVNNAVEFWGIEFHPWVTFTHMQKRTGTHSLPTSPHAFSLAPHTFPIPAYHELSDLLQALIEGNCLTIHTAIKQRMMGENVWFSKRTIQRHFQRIVGLSPSQVQQIQRVHGAVRYLQEGFRPKDVAILTGFSDQAHLTRALRRAFDKTTRDLRPPK